MENPQIFALVAIAISVISIGLVAANVFNLQTTLINLNTSLVEQSQTIKSLNQQQNSTQQIIDEQQKSSMNMHDNIMNLTSKTKSLEDKISTLEDKVSSLEQRLQSYCLVPQGCPPTTAQKIVYFPGVAEFYNVAGGGALTDNRVFKQLPAKLPANQWVADFDYKFSSSTIPGFTIFALSTNHDDPESQRNLPQIIVIHGVNTNALFVEAYPEGIVSSGISIIPDTQYYVRLEKTPGQLNFSIFSDLSRTKNISGSPVTLKLPSVEYNNLNFIQHAGCTECGTARTLTAQIDNTKIYSGTEGTRQILFQDDYSSGSSWTQIGTSIAVNGSFIAQMPQVRYSDSMP